MLLCFLGKSFDSTERWAEVEAVKGRAVEWEAAHETKEA